MAAEIGRAHLAAAANRDTAHGLFASTLLDRISAIPGSIRSGFQTLNKKIWYGATEPMRNAAGVLSRLRPIFDSFIRSLQNRLAEPRATEARLLELDREVQNHLVVLQNACTQAHDIVLALITDIANNASHYGLPAAEHQALTDILNSLTAAEVAALSPNDVPRLQTFERRLVAALEVTQSWSEDRREWLRRKGANVIHKFDYRTEHRPLLKRCRRFVENLIGNARYEGINPEASRFLIQETVKAINELLDACAPGHNQPGFDAAKLRPILQLKAELDALLLAPPAGVPTRLAPTLGAARAFLTSWAGGGYVQGVTDTLRETEDPELHSALQLIEDIEKGIPNRIDALGKALQAILFLDEADPEWIEIPPIDRRRMEKTRDYLLRLASRAEAPNAAELLRVKDYAQLVKAPIVAAANKQVGSIKYPVGSGFGRGIAEKWRGLKYTSVPQVVKAAEAIEDLNQIRNNPRASEDDIRRFAENTIASISSLVKWSRETNRALTPPERFELEELKDALREALRDNRIDRIRDDGDVGIMVARAQAEIDRWKKSTVRRNQASLPEGGPRHHPLKQAAEATQALITTVGRAVTNRADEERIEAEAARVRNALVQLQSNLELGLVPVVGEAEKRALMLQIQRALVKAEADDLATSPFRRAELKDALQPLSKALTTMAVQHAGLKPVSEPRLTFHSFETCPDQLRMLTRTLINIESAIESGDADQIVKTTRYSLALLTAMLQLAGAPDKHAIARNLNLRHVGIVDQLLLLHAHLLQAAHKARRRGGRVHAALTITTSIASDAVERTRQFLQKWEKANDEAPRGGMLHVERFLVGTRKEIPQLSEELWQRTCQLFLELQSDEERLELYRQNAGHIERQLAEGATSNRQALTTALAVLKSDEPPSLEEAGSTLGSLGFLGQTELQAVVDRTRPLEGLSGQVIKWGFGRFSDTESAHRLQSHIQRNLPSYLPKAMWGIMGLLPLAISAGATAGVHRLTHRPAPALPMPGAPDARPAAQTGPGLAGTVFDTVTNLFTTGAPQSGGAMGTIQWLLQKANEFYTTVRGRVDSQGLGAVPKMAIQETSRFLYDRLLQYTNSLNPDENVETIAQLRKVLEALEAARDKGTIDKAIEATAKALEYIGVLPSSEPSLASDTFGAELQDVLEKALNFNVKRDDNTTPIEQMIQREKKAFTKNTADFGVLKYIYEKVCDLKAPDVSFYADLMTRAKNTYSEESDQKAELKRLFMAKLHENGVSGLDYYWASFVYFFAMWLGHRLMPRAFEGMMEWTESFIDKNNTGTNSRYDTHIIKRTSGYLAVLQSAFNRIANNPTITGPLADEIAKELDLPAVNGGYTHKKLYDAIAGRLRSYYILPMPNDIWTKTKARSPLCYDLMFHRWMTQKWDEKQEKYLEDVPRWSNPAGQYLARGVSWCIENLIWIFQNLFYLICAAILRYNFNGEMIDTLVGQTVGSLQIKGYTHALNSVLYDQLKDVLIMLQRHYGKIPADDRGGDGDGDKLDLKNMSSVDRENLRTLVKELFSVLPKSECGSPTELRKLLVDKSLVQKGKDVLHEIDDELIYSQVTESAMELIGLAVHTLLKKGQMQKILYNMMRATNSIYETGKQPEEREMREKEEGVTRLLDNILQLVIENTVDEAFDVDRTKESKVAKEFTKEMHEITRKYLDDLTQQLTNLERLRVRAGDDSAQEVREQLKGMLEVLEAARQKLEDLLSKIRPSKEVPHCKETLLKMGKELTSKLMAIGEPLAAIYRAREQYYVGRNIAATLDTLRSGLIDLDSIFRHVVRGSDYQKARDEITSLRQNVTALKDPNPAVERPCVELETALDTASHDVDDHEDYAIGLSALREQLRDYSATTTFSKWFQNLGRDMSRAELREHEALYKKMQEAIRTLPCDDNMQRILLQQLYTLQGSNAPTRNEKYQTWRQTLAGVEKGFEKHMNKSQDSIQKTVAASRKVLDTMREFATYRAPRATYGDVIDGRDALHQWFAVDNGIKEPKLSPSWSDQILKTFASRPVKSIVKSKIKHKVDGLVKFIRQPYNWRYGVFHHHIFIPFVQAPIAQLLDENEKEKAQAKALAKSNKKAAALKEAMRAEFAART